MAAYSGCMKPKQDPAATTPAAPAATPPLPHEQEQSPGHVNPVPQPEIAQAQRDIEAGQVDTDLRATPGLDAPRRDQLVKKPTRPR